MAKAKPNSLSPEDIEHLRAELAAGRPPAVWFTSAAVGVEAGRSGKVMALTDPEEGDFIQVRPTGDKDDLSFSPGELTLEKPAPRKRAPAAQKEPEPTTESAPVEHIYTPAPPPPKPKPAPAPASAARPAPAAKPAGARKNKPAEVTVTLVSTAEGEWTVDVQWGSKRTLKAAPVAASAVAQAAKLLPPEVDEAVDSVLTAARERHLARVEQLRAELEAAQRALDDLTG